MKRKRLWYMFGKPSMAHFKWVLKKLASFFVGGLILTIILTVAYSLAAYITELSSGYNTLLSWDIVRTALKKTDAARKVVDNLSVSMCIWALLEVTLNTKSTIQRKFRRLIIVYIIICIIWFIVEKLIVDSEYLIILDFGLISVLIVFSWIHDFLSETENLDNRIGTGRDDGSVSNIIKGE